MGRFPRPDLPGVAFHITARAQHGFHVFTSDLRDRIVKLLRWQLQRSDATLLAYVIMTNHLHLVVVQGQQPLKRLMQPFLRSVALATHGRHGTEGHVFERRFHDRYCRDAAHLRTAIAYTHANPVRAGICRDPSEYRWSSHALYAGSTNGAGILPAVDVATGLEAFVPTQPGDWSRRGRSAYAEFLGQVLARPDDEPHDLIPGPRPPDPGVTPTTHPPPAGRPSGHTPIEAVAQRVLDAHGHQHSLRDLKSRRGPRSRLGLRAAVAIAASREGYSGCEIAEFLDVSTPTVSRMLRATPLEPR